MGEGPLVPGDPASVPEGLAIRLARHLVASGRFQAGVPPEAQALLAAADIVLTGSDGLTFTLVCIVDRERDPTRAFGLPVAEVEAIGAACARYAAAFGGAQTSPAIKIVEVGRDPPDAAQRARLAGFRRHAFFTRCILSAWVLDTTNRSLWTTAPFGGRLSSDRPFLERLLREPDAAPGTLQPPPAVVQAPGAPVAAAGLLALLVAVFVAEQAFPVDPPSAFLTPGLDTLVALGALNPARVAAGEGWRLLSSALLHGSLMHILFNGIALLMAGRFLESLVGRAWFLALFALGAVGGSAMSLVLDAGEVTVGASGAIMALLGAASVASLRLPRGPQRAGLQIALAQMLVPSLLPIVLGHDTVLVGAEVQRIAYGGHLGGALTGALAGLALMRAWPRDEPLPRLRRLAAAIVLAAAGVTAYAMVQVARGDAGAAADHRLIPDDQLPRSRAEERRRAQDLLARFPADPRAHVMEAQRLLEEPRDLAGAERELRAALADKALLARLRPAFAQRAHGLLALVLAGEGRDAEARAAAGPACEAPSLREPLRLHGLCPD